MVSWRSLMGLWCVIVSIGGASAAVGGGTPGPLEGAACSSSETRERGEGGDGGGSRREGRALAVAVRLDALENGLRVRLIDPDLAADPEALRRLDKWRGDGRELFYVRPDATMMSVRVPPEGVPGDPEPLFKLAIDPTRLSTSTP